MDWIATEKDLPAKVLSLTSKWEMYSLILAYQSIPICDRSEAHLG